MKKSVQRLFVPIETIEQNLLCLHTTRRSYRAILEVSGLNYLLKGEQEQEALALIFQQILGGLKHPVQVLLRTEPFDQERYLHQFGAMSDEPASDPVFLSADLPETIRWQRLNNTYRQFFRNLATGRTLLERHFYLIIPADPVLSSEERLVRLLRRKRATTREQAMDQAAQQLDLRCGEISRQLAGLGLTCRRLEHHDLVRLIAASLHQHQTLSHPLHPEWIEAVGHIHQPRLKSSVTLRDVLQQEPGEYAPNDHTDDEPWRLTPQWANLFAPASIRMAPEHLVIEEAEWTQTITVRHLPRFVQMGWLRPLVALDEPMELSIFYQPCPTPLMVDQLRRKQLEIESSLKADTTRGRSPNPTQQVAARDLERMLEALASGDSLLDLSVHILVRGRSQQELTERSERIQAVLYNMLLKAQPVLFEQDRGFRSCLPYAINELADSRIRLDSASASTSLPFLIPTSMLDDGEQRGILEGVTPAGDPIFLDWWSSVQRNANRLIVAPSGSGKSFKAKLDLMRTAQRYAAAGQRAQQIVIDPEREFLRPGLLALGGQWIRFAAGSEHHINPFDLPSPDGEDQKTDVLAETIQNAQALFDIMLADRTSQGPGTLSNQEKGLLDRVLYEAYREKGMTADRRTHTLTPPLLRDAYRILESGACGDDTTGLAARMRRFVSGSLAGLFSGPTNVAMDQSVVVMDSHDLDPELRPVALFLIANFIWTISFGSRIPRQLIVDELLSLYQYPEGKRFLESIFQRARKHYLGVTGMTQHPFILRESTIVSNCGYVALLGQEPSSLDLLTDIFKLSLPERQQLLTFGKGDALLLTHEKRLCVHFACSDLEYRYATSNPVDLARFEAEEQEYMRKGNPTLLTPPHHHPIEKGGIL
jgi:hypothetical protein